MAVTLHFKISKVGLDIFVTYHAVAISTRVFAVSRVVAVSSVAKMAPCSVLSLGMFIMLHCHRRFPIIIGIETILMIPEM